MHIHIKNIHIHAGQPKPQLPNIAGILSILTKDADNHIHKTDECAPTKNRPDLTKSIPAIGKKWGNLDAVYAGITRGENGEPDAHLILWNIKPEKDLNYKDAHNWAVAVDPATNSHIANKVESALLYANLKDQFETDNWYWTSTQSSADYVYGQDFTSGGQHDSHIRNERRVRAVSRLPL
jgi:hypothetical protein